MSGEYEKAISIGKAIGVQFRILSRAEILLPAIQRKFFWSTSQIEVLVDSIMRGYPINTVMLSEVAGNPYKGLITVTL